MAQRRTKDITLDGASFMIASLTVEQVEAYLMPFEDLDTSKLTQVKNRTYDIICNGLNNAMLDEEGNMPAGARPWTHERIRKDLDLPLIDFLNAEIIQLSGLKLIKLASGEPQAATEPKAEISASSPPVM